MTGILQGKVCLVTGSSRGIGRKIVEVFASNGAIVYANARTPGTIDDYCAELSERYKAAVIPTYFDVTDSAAAKASIMQINKAQKRLDVLVNNAGVMQDALIGMVTRKLMEDTFATNVFAVMELLQLAAKMMSRQKSGSIINMSSIVGVTGCKGYFAYSASKGAVISLTKTAAKELAPQNIRVNALAPGMIDTDMFRSIGEDHVAERLKSIGMSRLGKPEEIANACLFLASDLSEYVTGQIIGVDGSAVV